MRKSRNSLIDLHHPFFRPVWRRWALVIVLAIWALVETLAENTFWAVLAGGLCAYALYVFNFDFDLSDDDAPPKR